MPGLGSVLAALLGLCCAITLAQSNGLIPAPEFGDAGDLLRGRNWNRGQIRTRCVAVPARNDGAQDVPAANFFVRTAGDYRSKDPVYVLIHGTSASHNYWLRSGLLLSRTGFVVMIDLRGHGQTQVTPTNGTGFRYTYEVFADDVEAILKQLIGAEKRVVFAGISIGGSIGIRLATRYPARVEKLVTVSAAPQFRCADFPNLACKPYLTGIATDRDTLLPEDGLSGCNVSLARAKIDQNRQANTSGVAVSSLIANSQTVDLTPILSQVRCPTLVMHGLGDRTLGVGAADAIATGVLQASRVDFVNRGHLLPITSPTDVANMIMRFAQSASFPRQQIVFDIGRCDVAPEVAPEASFAKCPSV